MQETEIKYLAGLLDADGTLNYKISHGCLYLRMSISASESIDKNHYIPSLANKFGIVYKREFSKEKPTWSDAYVWEVSRENDLNILLPRITKHMVIKGKIWREMYDTWLASKGKKINDIPVIKSEYGPIKPKKHPTWAWVAGYLDGDGCYFLSKKFRRVTVQCHIKERQGVDLLYKAFGGYFTKRSNQPHLITWVRNLGSKDRSFALDFLAKMARHTHLKKWKIEQLISYLHNNGLQRLNKNPSTEEVIV